jgi:GntR family transcriptional regulator
MLRRQSFTDPQASAAAQGHGMHDSQFEEFEAILAIEASASNAPKYAVLQRAIERCIQSGLLKPGTRVPTEVELTRRLPVSLGTVQRAFSELMQRGLLVKSRKAGTFVAEHFQAPPTYVYRFRRPEIGAYALPFTRVLKVSKDDSPGPWRDVFRRKWLARIYRLVWIEEEPPAFSRVYVAMAHGQHLIKQQLDQSRGSSWHRLLRQRFDLPTFRMQYSFATGLLTAYACKQLELSKRTIGTVCYVLNFTFDDNPVLFQRYQREGKLKAEISKFAQNFR